MPVYTIFMVKVYSKNGEFVRMFPSLIEVSIFLNTSIYEIEIAMQNKEYINGYYVQSQF